jgi:hypothetical protein
VQYPYHSGRSALVLQAAPFPPRAVAMLVRIPEAAFAVLAGRFPHTFFRPALHVSLPRRNTLRFAK